MAFWFMGSAFGFVFKYGLNKNKTGSPHPLVMLSLKILKKCIKPKALCCLHNIDKPMCIV